MLETLRNGRVSTTVISKSPQRRINLRKWGAIDLVLKIRRENPTYGKTKITIILKMLRKYNEYRPHVGLKELTPAEYIQAHSETLLSSHFT